MRKSLFLFVMAFGVTVLFPSCLNLMSAALDSHSTHKININEYNPLDQNATLTFDGSLLLKRWNGSDVKDIMYSEKITYNKDKVILTIPSGDTSLLFDVFMIDDGPFSQTAYRVPDVAVRCVLEAGKKYQIQTKTKKKSFIIGIYDVTKGSVLLEEREIGEKK